MGDLKMKCTGCGGAGGRGFKPRESTAEFLSMREAKLKGGNGQKSIVTGSRM